MEIKVYATLRPIVDGKSINLDGVSEITVEHMLQELCTKHPALRPKIFTGGDCELSPSIHIFINGRDMRYLNGLDTMVTLKDDVRIFPPVGGGVW